MEKMHDNFDVEEEFVEEICEEETVESNARGGALRRHNDRKKKSRRRRIVNFRCWGKVPDKHMFSIPLRYHAHKTNNKGKHRQRPGNYDKSHNWDARDQRRLDSMSDDLKEYGVEQGEQ
jgi:hypothetical protein